MRATELAPEQPQPYYQAALCLLELGRTSEARELLDDAVDRFPDHAGLQRLHSRLLPAVLEAPQDR